MSTTAATLSLAPPEEAATRSAYPVTTSRVIRSEWIKLRSVRSTLITLGFAGVAVAAFGVLISMFSSGGAIGAEGAAVSDPAGNSLFGTNIAQLVLGVLGAMLITTEYSTGLIRTTLTAVPKRRPVLWAKVAVPTAVSFTVMASAVAVAFFAGQALYGGDGAGASVFDPGVARALLGAAVFPTAIAVMGMALGTLMRPLLVEALGGVWVDLGSYLPSNAGQAVTALVHEPGQLSPLVGFGVMVGWVGIPPRRRRCARRAEASYAQAHRSSPAASGTPDPDRRSNRGRPGGRAVDRGRHRRP